MNDRAKTLGTITSAEGRSRIVIAREFPYGPGPLWEMLTKPDKLALWLAPGKIELRKGGSAKLDFADSGIVIDSKVSDIQIPHVVEYSWSGPGEPLRPLRFETRIVPYGTRLTLTVSIPAGEDAPRTAAGFEAHLEMLAAALEGVPVKFPFQHFKDMRAAYQAAMA
jgi:uncharacterized protein YndB with AHSA1/START domain